jgi:hypothetical protein
MFCSTHSDRGASIAAVTRSVNYKSLITHLYRKSEIKVEGAVTL